MINIQIRNNEVARHAIELREVTGFRVKRDENLTVTQAIGQLTVVNEPPNYEVAIGGVKVDQNTPFTISDIGAGNHKVEIKYFVLQDGDYVPFSIEKNVHVRPNQTELLRIDFNDYFGTLEINSNPGASISISGQSFGSTPKRIENIPIVQSEIALTARMGSPYDGTFTINRYANIQAGLNQNIFVDFYKEIELGKLTIQSNDLRQITLRNHDFDLSFNRSTNFNGDVVKGKYTTQLPGTRDLFEFYVYNNKTTEIFLPIPQSQQSNLILPDIEGYFSLRSYLSSRYRALPETINRKVLDYNVRKWGDISALISVFSGTTVLISAIYLSAGREDYVPVILVSSALFLISSIGTKTKPVPNQRNIQLNTIQRTNLVREYQLLEAEWQKKLNEENERRAKYNLEIQEKNENLPLSSIRYY